MKKGNKAITLIALVITIIVLLILAGVTISTLTGENGILNRAKTSKEETFNATIKENISMAIMQITSDFYEQGLELKRENLTQNLLYSKDKNISEYGLSDADSGIYTLDNKSVKFIINEDMTISLNGETHITVVGSETSDTDNISVWLNCAGIENQYSYYTIDEVINDNTCFDLLINSKNAVDYMVRSNNTIMPGIVSNITAMQALSQNTYASYKAISNTDSRNIINESQNIDYFDQQSILPQKINSGISLCNNYSTTYKAEYAFDADTTTQWYTQQLSDAYIGYDFEEPINIYKIVIKKGQWVTSNDYYVKDGHIQYSDDGTTWTNTSDDIFTTTAGDTVYSYYVKNSGEHQYWRITCESSRWVYWDQVAVGELEMYGRQYITNDDWYNWASMANINGQNYEKLTDLVNDTSAISKLMESNEAVDYMMSNSKIMRTILKNQDAMNILANSSYAVEKILSDKFLLNMVLNSSNSEIFDTNSIIPQNMSTGSAIYSTYSYSDDIKPENAFDGTTTTQWWTGTPNGAYIGYDFGKNVKLYKITLKKTTWANSYDYYVKDGHIQYSDDGTTWTNTSDDKFTTTAGDTVSTFGVSAGSHRYWRITCESSRWVYWDQVAVGELEMYAK